MDRGGDSTNSCEGRPCAGGGGAGGGSTSSCAGVQDELGGPQVARCAALHWRGRALSSHRGARAVGDAPHAVRHAALPHERQRVAHPGGHLGVGVQRGRQRRGEGPLQLDARRSSCARAGRAEASQIRMQGGRATCAALASSCGRPPGAGGLPGAGAGAIMPASPAGAGAIICRRQVPQPGARGVSGWQGSDGWRAQPLVLAAAANQPGAAHLMACLLNQSTCARQGGQQSGQEPAARSEWMAVAGRQLTGRRAGGRPSSALTLSHAGAAEQACQSEA